MRKIKKGGGVSNKLRVVRICVYCKFVMVVSESQRQRKDEDNDDNHSIHSTIGDTLSFQQLERLHDKQIATILRYYQLFEASNSIPIMKSTRKMHIRRLLEYCEQNKILSFPDDLLQQIAHQSPRPTRRPNISLQHPTDITPKKSNEYMTDDNSPMTRKRSVSFNMANNRHSLDRSESDPNYFTPKQSSIDNNSPTSSNKMDFDDSIDASKIVNSTPTLNAKRLSINERTNSQSISNSSPTHKSLSYSVARDRMNNQQSNRRSSIASFSRPMDSQRTTMSQNDWRNLFSIDKLLRFIKIIFAITIIVIIANFIYKFYKNQNFQSILQSAWRQSKHIDPSEIDDSVFDNI